MNDDKPVRNPRLAQLEEDFRNGRLAEQNGRVPSPEVASTYMARLEEQINGHNVAEIVKYIMCGRLPGPQGTEDYELLMIVAEFAAKKLGIAWISPADRFAKICDANARIAVVEAAEDIVRE